MSTTQNDVTETVATPAAARDGRYYHLRAGGGGPPPVPCRCAQAALRGPREARGAAEQLVEATPAADPGVDELGVEELLVEEISIDGMCGVY